MNTRRQKIRRLCECSMMIALATVLSMIKIYEAPLGGSVTLFSMVPILICGYVYGAKTGFATAFVYSVIQLLFGIGTVAYVPDPLGIVLCILLDYTFAFSVLGIAGLFRKLHLTASEEKNRYINLTLGSLSALILRFALHILSGKVIFGIDDEHAYRSVHRYKKGLKRPYRLACKGIVRHRQKQNGGASKYGGGYKEKASDRAAIPHPLAVLSY